MRPGFRLLFIAVMALQVPAAQASDWVDGDIVRFRNAPGNMPLVKPPPAQPSNSNDGAVPVNDPGSPGSAPDQRSPNALQGNISEMRAPTMMPQAEAPPVQRRIPPPETKIVGPKVFQSWLQQTHPDFGTHQRVEVLDVRGQWDDSAHALHSFGIPFTKIASNKLLGNGLVGAKLLIVDCAGNLQPAELEAVNHFVKNGGYLITTDWALDGCLVRAIPGFVMWNGGYTSSELVDAHVVADDPPLLKGTVPRAYWKLDNKSQTLRVLKPNAVEVLVRSRLLLRDDPDQLGILAVTFNYGKGKVLHLVGHFDNNSEHAFNNALDDPAPGLGISLRQAIAANFCAEALSRKDD